MSSGELKKCTKCGEEFPATAEFFGKCKKNNKIFLVAQCKQCRSTYLKKYRINNRDTLNKKQSDDYKKNKITKLKEQKQYYEQHKIEINRKRRIKNLTEEQASKRREQNRERYHKNKSQRILTAAIYRSKHRPKILEQKRQSYAKNRQHYLDYQKQYKKTKHGSKTIKSYKTSPIKYIAKAFQNLIFIETTRCDENGFGEIKCPYCGAFFKPNKQDVNNRNTAINNIDNNQASLIYCSNNCKYACPIYYKSKWPKGSKKASSREVNPLIRQMCFKYDDYECQKCGATQEDEQLHCHHIKGAAKEPLLANDIDNVITLCKTCHKWVHAQIDCGYADYQRPKCVEA